MTVVGGAAGRSRRAFSFRPPVPRPGRFSFDCDSLTLSIARASSAMWHGPGVRKVALAPRRSPTAVGGHRGFPPASTRGGLRGTCDSPAPDRRADALDRVTRSRLACPNGEGVRARTRRVQGAGFVLPGLFPGRPEMRVVHETIYQALYAQGSGQLRRNPAGLLRSGPPRRVHPGHERPGLLLRSGKPMAAGHEREHEWPAPPVLPQGARISPSTRRTASRWWLPT